MNTFINEKKYRYELKFLLNDKYAEILQYRMSLLMEPEDESHVIDGKYLVRSLYFDDVYNTAYYEKMDGLCFRKKFRIRFYNMDSSYIVLELKGKDGNLTYKKSDIITIDEYNFIISKEYDKIKIGDRKILGEFIDMCKLKNLIPSIIVDYERVVYTYPIEDVRITFDSSISSGQYDYDLFNKDMLLFDVLDRNMVVMEVKFNNYIPKVINDIIKTVPSSRISLSKFTLCKEKKGV